MKNWTSHQNQAITAQAKSLVISAAAGAGKTAVLVERVIQKIINGQEIDRLLIVTFTNAAANEMRARIYAALSKQSVDNPHIARQIALLPRANICTIHSFCQTLLRNYFYLLDISAGFEIADENKLAIMQEEVVDEILTEEYERKDANFELLVENFGGKRDDSELANLICNIHRFSQSAANPEEWLEQSDTNLEQSAAELIEKFKTDLIGLQKEYTHAIKISCESGLEKYAAHLRVELEALKNISQSQAWDEIYNALNNLTFLNMPCKEKEADETTATQVKKIRAGIKDALVKYKTNVFFANYQQMQADMSEMQPQLGTLCNLVKKFSERFTERKNTENMVDFNDLEHLTIKLLNQNAKEIAEKYDEIYIDEFQDTNSAQSYIFEKLAEHTKSFIVGDIKQSIYGFRNAEPKIFLGKIQKGEGLINLSHNFRSHPEVINSINHIFRTLMSEKVGDVEYNENHALVAGRENVAPNQAPIEIHLIEPPTPEAEAEEEDQFLTAIEREAKFVTNRIIELVENEKALKYEDIAIISRQTKVASTFAETLSKAGVPVICDDSAGFFAADEISDALSLLRIIDNQWQDIPLIAAMRSRLFKFTDDELAEIRLRTASQRTANHQTPNEPFYEAVEKFGSESGLQVSGLQVKCQDFIRQINDYIEQSKTAAIAELLDSIVYNTNIDYDANLQLMRQYAAEFESQERRPLCDFIGYIDSCIEKKLDFATPRTMARNSDAVRIMTIHKSKGLEFKAVFLVGCGKKFNTRDIVEPILYDFQRGIATDYKKEFITRPTLRKLAIKEARKRDAISEEMRILYVALTRAEERLFIYGSVKNAEQEIENWKNISTLPDEQRDYYIANQKRFINWLGIALPNQIQVNNHLENILKLAKNEIEIEYKLSENNLKNPKIKSTQTPLKASVSELLSQDNNNNVSHGQSSSAYRGKIVHFVMQNLDISRTNSQEEIETQLNEMKDKQMLTSEDVKLVKVDKIADLFQSDLGKRLKQNKYKREVKFFTNLQINDAEIHVQGVIDCYFEENDEIVIIDFKTGKKAATKLQSSQQIEIYSQALNKILGKKVKECYVYGGL